MLSSVRDYISSVVLSSFRNKEWMLIQYDLYQKVSFVKRVLI